MARSDAHDRIVLRIERAVPAKHFDGDSIRLYPAAAPGEGLLDDILQKAVLAASRVELGALPDAGELGRDTWSPWTAVSPLPMLQRESRHPRT
ncbi:hypothetical protein HB772_21565 (plasmid) [Sinorhizobium meliloti]|nr:hypothetical protein HB772_21565 [Sinorhizobium meliloti]